MTHYTIADLDGFEQSFFTSLQSKVKQRLKLYCVTGGFGRRDIVPGWSDIDILLVFDVLSEDLLLSLGYALEETASPINIGATFYSHREIEHKLALDPKTWWSLYYIKQGEYVPRIQEPKLILPEPSLRKLKEIEEINYGRCLHDLKRELILGSHINEQKVYKLCTVLLKIQLHQKSIIALGYSDIINKAIQFLPGCPLTHQPQDILGESLLKSSRIRIYYEFILWLECLEREICTTHPLLQE